MADTADTDALTLLIEDHHFVDDLFEQYQQAASDPTSRKGIVDRIIAELSVHAAIEEQILYPVMREALPDGEEQVTHALQEHEEMKVSMLELEQMSVDAPGFDDHMQVLIQDVRHHVEEEEDELFSALREHVEKRRLVELGRELALAKQVAPRSPLEEPENRELLDLEDEAKQHLAEAAARNEPAEES